MDSEDLSQSYSEESFVLDNNNNDDVEMSHAAISMISSISPQFTNDFFQRTKLKRFLSRKQSTLAIKQPKKTSQFAKYNKEDDFNIKQVNSSIEKSGEQSVIEQKQTDSTMKNNKFIDTHVTIISPKENQKLLEDDLTPTPKKTNIQLDVYNEIDEISSNNERSSQINANGFGKDQSSLQSNKFNFASQNIFSDENLVSPQHQHVNHFIISPKTQFLNLKRPKDPRLDKRKLGQIAKFMENSTEKISDNEEQEHKQRSQQKQNSIILYNNQLNQDSISSPSEFLITNELSQKSNLRLRYIKGEALKNFANDFGKASTLRYQKSPKMQSKSLKAIEPMSHFNKLQAQKQFAYDVNSPIDVLKGKTTLEIPKIKIPESNDESNPENYSRRSNRKPISTRQINSNTLQSKFLSDKDLGGILSPIPHISENSPYNFTHFSEGFKNMKEPKKQEQQWNQNSQPQAPLKSLLKHMNSLKVKQINEEQSESSQIMNKSKSQNNQDEIDQQNENDAYNSRSHKSSSKKSDNENDQSLINMYQNNDYIKQNSEFTINEFCNFIANFDRMKEFELYFPDQNYSKVINKFNTYRRKSRGYKAMILRKKNQVKKKLAIFNKLHF